MRFNLFAKLIPALAVVGLLAACASPAAPAAVPTAAAPTAAAPAQAAITLTDAAGRSVTLAKVPQRIVMAGKAVLMVADAAYFFPQASQRVAALGSTQQGSGDFMPLIDPAIGDKPRLATDAGPEQIAGFHPDLVLLKSSMAEKLGKPLESLGLPVVYVDFETPEQYKRDLAILGKVFQDDKRAADVADYYQQRLANTAKALQGLTEDQKPRLLMLYYTDKDGAVAFNVPPAGWMQTLVAELAGGRPVWKDAAGGGNWSKVGFEQIAAWNPDQVYIIAYTANVDEVTAKLKKDPQWQSLRAVKEGKIYGFPVDVYSWDQPDTRWVLGFTWLAAKVHPERFKDFNLETEMRQFYSKLYGMDDAAFKSKILPLLKGDVR